MADNKNQNSNEEKLESQKIYDYNWEKFLLAEHERFSEAFWRNEEVGEKRVNFFITLATLVLSGLGILTSFNGRILTNPSFIKPIIILAAIVCFGMLCLGYLTMFRVMKRNKGTDALKVRLDMIREQFQGEAKPDDYKPFDSNIIEKRIRKLEARKFSAGGLLTMTVFMNLFISLSFPWLAFMSLTVLNIVWIKIPWCLLVIGSILVPFIVGYDMLNRFTNDSKRLERWEWRAFGDNIQWKKIELNTLLNYSEETKWTDCYFLSNEPKIGLKLRLKTENNRKLAQMDIKIQNRKREDYEEWIKYSSTHIEIDPTNARSANSIKQLRSKLFIELEKKKALRSSLFTKILRATEKPQLLTINKKRKQIRAQFDKKHREWKFQFKQSNDLDIVIIEKTFCEFKHERKKIPQTQTISIESENLKTLKKFKEDFGLEEVEHVMGYPQYIMKIVN